MSECGDLLAKTGEVTKQQAEEILQRVRNMAQIRAQRTGIPVEQAVKVAASILEQHDKLSMAIAERNHELTLRAKENLKNFVDGAVKSGLTINDGIMAALEGENKVFPGSRLSIDYQQKQINNKFFGKMVAQLEDEGVLRDFKDNRMTQDIYREMGELKTGGSPGITNNKSAQTIAKIVDDTTKEMVARQNNAGAYVGNLPGYIVRQTHDMSAIRDLGRTEDGNLSKQKSFSAWSEFTMPLLDHERTFLGQDPGKFMRNIHEGIYTGIHGAPSDVGYTGGYGVRGDIARRASAERILHFSDSDAAWQYNQRFGTRDFREQVLTDIHNRARAIGLMESLGPTSESTLNQAIRELQERYRESDDAARQVGSINQTKIASSYRMLTGENQIPQNPTLARISGNIKTIVQMAKMGGVFLSKLFGDKAFMQAEMSYQGISNMTTLAKQLTGIAKRSPDEQRMLRLMGVGLDGIQGNALSRYSDQGMMSAGVNRAQRAFFDLNFLNYWTDVHKSAAAELMAAHLGEHADMKLSELPEDLRRTLSLYKIDDRDWDRIRSTTQMSPSGQQVITAEGISGLDIARREANDLENKLRTYFSDRVDYAVPTPGGAERRIATFGTKAGTPLGEAVRLMMLFKSFPITVMHRILARDVYGRGANTAMQWLLNDHQGKFHMASLIAMTTIGGYLSQALRDAINGKTPQELTTDGKINYDVLTNSAIRGGSLGLMGDLMLRDYEREGNNILEEAAGPVLGQADLAAETVDRLISGKNVTHQIGKMTMDNTPYVNLFYVRPVLNYFVLWNLEQMMDPSRVQKMQSAVDRGHQHYFMGPASD